ncbi:MAG: dihydroorotate dehydrogenase electron transfer subunit [Ignavibacteria bacterium]
MLIANAPIEKNIELDNQIYLLKVHCPEIAGKIKPGEFLNIRVSEAIHPLLRRPFSVCDVEGDYFYIMFNIYGEGTRILSQKHGGDTIDVLGPLGKGFDLKGDFEIAVIVAGGLGAAPFPYLIRTLGEQKEIYCFIGGKTHKDVILHGMRNISIATDDGSLGFKGNVIQLLDENLKLLKSGKVKIFACGPTAMLRTLKNFAVKNSINCEASTECAMACGFGICMGCPVESAENPNKYFLVCKDGPVFNIADINL